MSFSVRAHNSAGWGPWSGASPPVTPDIEPGRPAAPTVQFADGALLVSAGRRRPTRAARSPNYDLQIGGGASAIQRIGNTTTFRWEGLHERPGVHVPGARRERQGRGPVQLGRRHPSTRCARPTRRRAPAGERGDKTINVSWGAPGNGGDPVIEYQVQILSTGATNRDDGHVAAAGPTCPTASPSSSRCGPATGPGGARHRRRRRPSCRAACPTQTGGVTAARGDGAATVSWGAPGNQGCAITGYTVRTNQGQSMNVGGGVTSTTFGGLSNGTSYTFTVVARNEVGDGAASAASNAVDAGRPAPARRRSPAPPPTPGGSRVTWTAANNNGSPITAYQLSVNGGAWEPRRHRHVVRPGPGWPTARRTRSRCAP